MAELKPICIDTSARLPGIVKYPNFPFGYQYRVVWESDDTEVFVCTRLFKTKEAAIDAWNKRSK